MAHRRTMKWKRTDDGSRKLDKEGDPIPDTWRYYFEHEIPGRGRVARSLGTSDRRTAERRENRLLELLEKGRADLVRAWLDGQVTLRQLRQANTDEKLGELTRELRAARRPDVSLQTASDKALKVKRGENVSANTIGEYRRVHRDFGAWAARMTEIEGANREAKALEAREEEERGSAAAEAPSGRRRRKAPWSTDTYREAGLALPVRAWMTTDRVKEYLGARRDLGRAKRTVHNDQTALSMLATYCEGKGWIDEGVDLKWEAHQVRIHYLTEEQCRAYMTEARPGEERAFFGSLIGAGMREGELYPRLAGDFLFEETSGHGVRCRVRLGKTAGATRNLFVPSWSARLLQALIEEQGLGPGDRLFTTPLRTLQKRHHEICAALGIRPQQGPDSPEVEGNPNYTIHDHRHTAAVYLARAGMPLNQLQRQLGHSTLEQTMRYAVFHPEYSDVAPYFGRVADRLGLADLGAGAAGDEERGTARGGS